MIGYYKNLISQNFPWIKKAGLWALLWFLVGALSFAIYPNLAEIFTRYLEEVFKEILGAEEPVLDFSTTLLIFRQNVVAVVLSLFLGIAFGIVPLLALGVNFFILGFLFAVVVLGVEASFLFGGVAIFLLSIIPHGILEIPALLLAGAFGLKLGFAFGKQKSAFLDNLKLFPLLALMLFGAALLEIFVTGNILKFLYPK